MACRGYPFWAPNEKALAQRERRAEVAAAAAKSRVAKATPIMFGSAGSTVQLYRITKLKDLLTTIIWAYSSPCSIVRYKNILVLEIVHKGT